MHVNPKTNPLYFKKEIHNLLLPYIKNKKISKIRKLIGIIYATYISPTYLDKDNTKMQAVPGKIRSIDDTIRMMYGLGWYITVPELFKLINRYVRKVLLIDYCSTIERNTLDVETYCIEFFYKPFSNRKYSTVVDDWDYKDDINIPKEEYNILTRIEDNGLYLFIKYKLFNTKIKLNFTKGSEGLNIDDICSCTLQEGLPDFILWSKLPKDIKISYYKKEQYSI